MSDAERIVSDGAKVVGEACRYTGLGRTTLYALMETGKIRFIKVGRRRLIPVSELKRILAENLIGNNSL